MSAFSSSLSLWTQDQLHWQHPASQQWLSSRIRIRASWPKPKYSVLRMCNTHKESNRKCSLFSVHVTSNWTYELVNLCVYNNRQQTTVANICCPKTYQPIQITAIHGMTEKHPHVCLGSEENKSQLNCSQSQTLITVHLTTTANLPYCRKESPLCTSVDLVMTNTCGYMDPTNTRPQQTHSASSSASMH